SHPAIGLARPDGDGLLLCAQVLARPRSLEETMGVTDAAGIGRRSQDIFRGRIVQRIIEARDRARRVAESRMGGDVLDPLAVDVDLAPLTQAFEILRPCEWPIAVGPDVFRSHAFLPLAACLDGSILRDGSTRIQAVQTANRPASRRT